MKCLRLLPVLCAVLLSGCLKSKIHESRTWPLESGQSKEMQVEGPTGNQKINVKITSSDSNVDAYILLDDQLGAMTSEIDPDKLPPAAILDKSKGTKDATLSATIPAKKAYRIFVNNNASKKTTVIVKLDSV
ncbi:hypothetical protein [Zavarzinella formosa]|uniref:hypothetical protein n=1 Tax=Zavarzinella formosa TaxID=360055 RepID=UPI0003679BC1|nr:hypothetical protein [Zavarzinella formosa]